MAAFSDAFNTLEHADTDERAQIIAVIDEEIAQVADAIKRQQPPSSAFDSLGDRLSGHWNAITYHGALPIPDELVALVLGPYGRYMNLATVNLDHFGSDAWKDTQRVTPPRWTGRRPCTARTQPRTPR